MRLNNFSNSSQSPNKFHLRQNIREFESHDNRINMSNTFNSKRTFSLGQKLNQTANLNSNSKYSLSALKNYKLRLTSPIDPFSSKSNFNFFSGFDSKNNKTNNVINIEEIISTGNIQQIEANLEGLINSEFISENKDLVKLIKAFQQASEHLLDVQSSLEQENKILDSNNKNLNNNCDYLEKELKHNKDLIHHYKDTSKDIKYKFNIYKGVIDEHRQSESASERETNKKNIKKIIINYFYCDYCPNKKFSSCEKLNDHIERRHSDGINQNNHNNQNNQNYSQFNNGIHNKLDFNPEVVDTIMETKITKLKQELNLSLTNFNKENLNHLIENHKQLEKKLEEIIKSKEETNLNNTNSFKFESELKNMREQFVLTNESNNKKISSEVKNIERDIITSKVFESETKRMNDLLIEMNHNQNEKILNITEQIGKFKESIISELKEIKEIKHSNNNIENNEINIATGNSKNSSSVNTPFVYNSRRKSNFFSDYKPVHSADIEIIGSLVKPTNELRRSMTNKDDKDNKNFKSQLNNIIEENNCDDASVGDEIGNKQIDNLDRKEGHDKNIKQTQVNETIEEEIKKIDKSERNVKNEKNEKKEENFKKAKILFKHFLKREDQNLFVDLKSFKDINYNAIPDIQIVNKEKDNLKIKSKLDSYLNNLHSTIKKKNNKEISNDINKDMHLFSNTRIIKFDEITKSQPEKDIISLLSRTINASRISNKDQYYNDYMDNIYDILDIKKYLADEKIQILNSNRELILNSPKEDKQEHSQPVVNKQEHSQPVVNEKENSSKINEIKKDSKESIQTGQFNDSERIDEFDI